MHCLILDITDVHAWVGLDFTPVPLAPSRPRRIPAGRICTVLQPDRETAEEEAMRLARQNPDGRFAVFELVALADSANVPTHTTLAGNVVACELRAKLADVTRPEEEPI